jgi:GNAT superfamily N-acetyltransferase
LEALAILRTEQGWQRSDPLLHAILTWEHGRIFLVREADIVPDTTSTAPAATTCAIAAGPVGVIGNVIVSAHYRRRGLGKLILRATLGWLRQQGVRSVFLDATEDGRPLYSGIGFLPVERSWFAHAPLANINRAALAERSAGARAALYPSRELGRLRALDAAAFGGDRLGLLALMLDTPHTWLYAAEDEAGAPDGYLILRMLDAPYVGIRVGPWVARTERAAAALFGAVLAGDAPWRGVLGADGASTAQFFASMAATNPTALALVEAVGAELVLDDVVMRLHFAESSDMQTPGEPGMPSAVVSHSEEVYAWLAPMVF